MAETKKPAAKKEAPKAATKPAAKAPAKPAAKAPAKPAAKPAVKAAATPKAEAKATPTPKVVGTKPSAPKVEKKVEKKPAKPVKPAKTERPKGTAPYETKGEMTVTLVKSKNGSTKKQLRTVQALGLKKIGDKKVHKDNPAIRGMCTVVAHLVKIEEHGESKKS